MQHRVVPHVEMKRETVPIVTTEVRYYLDAVRNGLLCIHSMGVSGIPRPTNFMELIQANIRSHLKILNLDALHHL